MATTHATPADTAPKGAKAAKNGKTAGTAGKSRKKLVVVLVLALALAGAGYKLFLATPAKAGPPAAGETVVMDPTTVNLSGGHYLKIGVAIQLVKGKATAADFQSSQAYELVIDQFSNRTVASLSSNATRKTLAKQLERDIEKAYPGEVFRTFLTQFVTQ